MKENKYTNANGNDSETSGQMRSDLNLKEAPGIYDRYPGPGYSEYPHSMGPNTIPVKFAESQPTSRAPSNLVMGANGREDGKTAPIPTTSRVNKKKNTYSSNTSGKGRMGHY